MKNIANAVTQDSFVDALTIEEFSAETLSYIVGNASVLARFKPARRETGGEQSWGPEQLIDPERNTVPNVSGVMFRSAQAGQPARVIARLYGSEDPQLSAGVPFTSTLTAAGQASLVPSPPVGAIIAYGGASDPSGWLICDGRAISRATFPDLFAAIGIAYGAGDGSTTFNIPDLRGRVPVGLGTNASVNTRGQNDGVAVGNRRPHHRHTPHSHNVEAYDGAANDARLIFTGTANSFSTHGPVATTAVDGGSGNANDVLNTPAFQVTNFIIATGT